MAVDHDMLKMAEEHLEETEQMAEIINRQQVELEAWRSGRLEHAIGGRFYIAPNEIFQPRFYDTIDEAVDALMEEDGLSDCCPECGASLAECHIGDAACPECGQVVSDGGEEVTP
jgi:hypothetical protein